MKPGENLILDKKECPICKKTTECTFYDKKWFCLECTFEISNDFKYDKTTK